MKMVKKDEINFLLHLLLYQLNIDKILCTEIFQKK